MPNVRLLELRNTYKWGGGPDKTILLSAERHDPSRVKVVVTYIRDVRDREFRIGDRARERRLTYYELPERGKFDLKVLFAIRDLVIQYDINLIHAHDYKTDLFAFLIRCWLWQRHIKVITTAHGWALTGLKGNLYRRLDLFLMRRFDHLIAVSHATRALMLSARLPERLISVVHNGIDTEAWLPGSRTEGIRREFGIDDAFPVIGYVGRLTEEKDFGTWLRVAKQVVGRYPAARFLFIGDGKDGEVQGKTQELAAELGIADRVNFVGYRENLQEIYAHFDLFLLTSDREGLPNCILEAMAMGIPVVSTKVGGVGELMREGETGFMLPAGDVASLASAVLTLLDDDQLRQRMGRAGRDRVEQEFSFTHRMQKIEDLYDHVVSNHCL